MRLTREDDPEAIKQFSHIRSAPIFGPLRCLARCPDTYRTCTLSKHHSGPHIAHSLFRNVLAVWDEDGEQATGTSLEFIKSRRAWKKLPPSFLMAVANRLDSVQDAAVFAEFCERYGILKDKMPAIAEIADTDEPEFALGMVAATLTSYANALADRQMFDDARCGLHLALAMKPRHFPAWSSMALVCFFTGDYTAAASWADKVLTCEPDRSSPDPWERVGAESRTAEGELFASHALNDPNAVGCWKELQHQMKEIKKACRERLRTTL